MHISGPRPASIFGQVRRQTSPESGQLFGYDAAAPVDFGCRSGDGTCISRTYALDADSNRTASAVYGPANGSCATSGTALKSGTHTYDGADRVTDTGYAFDPMGRTTTIPAAGVTGGAAMSVDYFANDMVKKQTQGSHTKTWTLDPASRLLAETDNVSGSTATNKFADGGDSPSWIASSDGTWTRNVQGLDGSLAVIAPNTGTAQVQLTNPHGDVVMTVDDATGVSVPNTYNEDTEFGVSRQVYDDLLLVSQGATVNGAGIAATEPTRYGWLGGKASFLGLDRRGRADGRTPLRPGDSALPIK